MDTPILVEIIAYAPTAFYHCMHCEVAFREMGKSERVQQEQLESSLPPDLLNQYAALSDWVREILRIHCDRVAIKVIDAASVEGVFKSLRHGVHRFPAVVIANRGRFLGEDALERAALELGRLMPTQSAVAAPS